MTNTINGTRQLGDWEHQKFREDSTGKPAIAVVNADGTNIGSALPNYAATENVKWVYSLMNTGTALHRVMVV